MPITCARALRAIAVLLWLPAAAAVAADRWTIEPAPDVDPDQHNELDAITCVASDDCWAVGDHYTTARAYQTLVEHWDGERWSIVPSPNSASDQTHLLLGITCVARDDCWAVGKHKTIVKAPADSLPIDSTLLIVDQTLAEHWDGSSWSIVTTPNTQVLENYLQDVDCLAADDCWAVGYGRNAVSGLYESLTLHWDGTAWGVALSPSAPDRDTYLVDVDCVGQSCIAVGQSSLVHAQTFALRWDGSAWTAMPTPNRSADHSNGFNGVACVAADDCWAVGTSDPGPTVGTQTLVAHWDGAGWTMVDSPNTDPRRNNMLFGVACVSAGECRAAGRHYNGVAEQALVLRWDGRSWSQVAAANSSESRYNAVWDIACAGPSDCHTIGYEMIGSVHQTLSAHSEAVADPFAFALRNGVQTAATVVSEPVTLRGLLEVTAVRIEGRGEFQVNDQEWTRLPAGVRDGDVLRVRHRSASSGSTLVDTTVDVGGVRATLRSITREADRSPDAFDFPSRTGVAPATLIESAVMTPAGFDTRAPVAPSGCEYRIDGGAWRSDLGALLPGQSLQLRQRSATGSQERQVSTVTVGGVPLHFATRTH